MESKSQSALENKRKNEIDKVSEMVMNEFGPEWMAMIAIRGPNFKFFKLRQT